jgi:hypothetical protein
VAFDWAKLEISESNEGTTKSSTDKTTTHSDKPGTSVPASAPASAHAAHVSAPASAHASPDDMYVSDKSDSTPKTTKEGSVRKNNRQEAQAEEVLKAAEVSTKRYLDVHINFDAPNEDQKSPIAVSHICINCCREWVKEIQDLVPSFKLHTIDKDSAQEILHNLSKISKYCSKISNPRCEAANSS